MRPDQRLAQRLRRGRRLLTAVVLGALTLSGCGAAHHSAEHSQSTTTLAPPSPPPPPVGELSYALDGVPPRNWNVLAAAGDSPSLTQIADQLWPSVFNVGPSFVPSLNAALVTSASVTSESPQTVVYNLNPAATWSDGVPISGEDFVYNWRAQSGQRGFSDVGGKAFSPASTAGYSQVSSVDVAASEPDVVVVHFSTPDPDWESLFSHLIPAHVADQIGFDSGFTDPVADLVSGGAYIVQSYTPGGALRLVRNPSYAGPRGTALALDFDFVPYQPQAVAALTANQVSCATVAATASTLLPLQSVKSLSVHVAGGPAYLDLDFREGSGPLASRTVRAAISDAVDRQSVTTAVLGAVMPGATPVSNRFFVPGEPGYADQAPAQPSVADLHRPSRSVSLRLIVGSDPLSAAAAREVASEVRSAGFTVTVVPVASVPVAEAGKGWDMAIEVRSLGPFPGAATGTYLAGSPRDVDGFESAAASALIHRAASTSGAARLADIDALDGLAWKDDVDVPLFAVPIAVACQASVVNVAANPAPQGPAYNAQVWGLASGAT
jgi:peptide/nickel transport system substrate-binding protein